ncbi:PilZ domain-containing protein [Tamilnaduibacter salinus]|nr:PilZ domain-containing protein [Tamilnaduibacter salinus]PVY76384.1 PilZ domain-containing protein [Tamilnaduibacter salinus]
MMTMRERSYIRHPTDIPLEVQPGSPSGRSGDVRNLSPGGLAFTSEAPYELGSELCLCIRCCPNPLQIRGQVVWCERRGNRYELGVAFYSPADAYQVRMVEQVCQIEQYRYDAWQREGRQLTQEEAAREWIDRYASSYAQDDWCYQEDDPGKTSTL